LLLRGYSILTFHCLRLLVNPLIDGHRSYMGYSGAA
jgi:hypothetical protein